MTEKEIYAKILLNTLAIERKNENEKNNVICLGLRKKYVPTVSRNSHFGAFSYTLQPVSVGIFLFFPDDVRM